VITVYIKVHKTTAKHPENYLKCDIELGYQDLTLFLFKFETRYKT